MITITVSGTDYSHNASPSEIAGLGEARSKVMSGLQPGYGQDGDTPLSERPGYVGDDVEWLQDTVQAWATRESADADAIQACMARCLASWSNQPAPEAPPAEPLSHEAETARRVAGIKAEAQRRIIALTGASDLQSCIIKQLNALMRATELARKEAQGWTQEEATEAAMLQSMADAIKAIRARSDTLELDPPEDWTNDNHWN